MKNIFKIIITILLIAVFLIGCSNEDAKSDVDTTRPILDGSNSPTGDTKVCTQDAKECSDGSFVSRDPKNNCEFTACPDESNTSNLSPEVKALQDKAKNVKSYEYLNGDTGIYLLAKEGEYVIKLKDVVYVKGTDFRYNTIYFVDSKAYGYCLRDIKYSSGDCDINTLENYIEVDYDEYYPDELAVDWILDLDNGEVVNTVTCENRKCDIVEFTKDDQKYRMEVRQTYGLPFKVSKLDDEGTQSKVALYTDVAFNHLKVADINPPDGYELLEIEE